MNYLDVINVFFIGISLFLLALSFYITSFKLKFFDLSSSCLFFLSAIFCKIFFQAGMTLPNIIFVSFSIAFFVSFIFLIFKTHGWPSSILGFFILLCSMSYFDELMTISENAIGALSFIGVICSYFFVVVFPWVVFSCIKKKNKFVTFVLAPITLMANIIFLYSIYQSGISFDKMNNYNLSTFQFSPNLPINHINQVCSIGIFATLLLVFSFVFLHKILNNIKKQSFYFDENNLSNLHYATLIFISSFVAMSSGIIFGLINSNQILQKNYINLSLPLNISSQSQIMLIMPIFYSILIYILAKMFFVKNKKENLFIPFLFLSAILFNFIFETAKIWNILEYVKMIAIIIFIILCDSQNIFLMKNKDLVTPENIQAKKKNKKISSDTITAISKQYI